MKRLLLCLALALLTSGCWAHATGVLVWTVIPSLQRGAEIRAARATGVNPFPPIQEDLTPLNAGRSEGPDRPTLPEPGGQESF